MTPEELSKLTPEEKRVKIAEMCGWAEIHSASGFGGVALRGYPWFEGIGMGEDTEEIPDYLNDLNAMHEAEKCIESDKQIESHLDNLTNVCGGDTPVGRASFTAYFATAAQRSDAFLLTINATPGKPDSSP